MSPLSKREYFKSIKTRYQEARLKQKSAILDEFCANCDYTANMPSGSLDDLLFAIQGVSLSQSRVQSHAMTG